MLAKFPASNRLLQPLARKVNLNYSSTYCKEQQITINGQLLNYIKTGNGNHSLLCFPGALGSIWTDFKPQIENLDKNKFTIVAWDPPGYGLSRPPNRRFAKNFYETDADIALQLMKALDINKFSLLGWSDGGISSMILAAKYPTAVNKLIIWGANSYLAQEDLEACESVSDISKWSEKMRQNLLAIYGKDGLQNMWTDWFDAIKDIYYKNNGNICKEKLSSIQCPTFILHGDKDPMVAKEHPGHLLSNIQGARLHRFPDGKHNIHLRYAAEFNELITKFLEEGYKSKL